jgi:hypothetical protein
VCNGVGLGPISLTLLRLLFELLLPIPIVFLLDLTSQEDFFKLDVMEATELDIFLFLELEEVNPNFLVFSFY